jgi:hypothetical protein
MYFAPSNSTEEQYTHGRDTISSEQTKDLIDNIWRSNILGGDASNAYRTKDLYAQGSKEKERGRGSGGDIPCGVEKRGALVLVGWRRGGESEEGGGGGEEAPSRVLSC